MTLIKLLLSVVLSFSMASCSRADDDFNAPLTLQIPKSTPGYQADPTHEKGDDAIYQTHGKLFSEGANATKLSDLPGATEPMATFKEIINSFGTKDPDVVKKFYDSEGAAALTKLTSDPQIRARWVAEAGRMGGGNLVAVIQIDTGTYYFLIKYPSSQGTLVPVPVLIRREGNAFLATSETISGQMIPNILMFLFNQPAEALAR